MKRILYTIVLLMTIATYSQEEVWTLYNISAKTGDSIYSQPFKKNRVWFKKKFKKPITIKGEKAVGYIQLFVFDCDNKRIGTLSSGYLKKNGSVFNYKQNNESVVKSIGMQYPFPDTQELDYLNFFCKNI